MNISSITSSLSAAFSAEVSRGRNSEIAASRVMSEFGSARAGEQTQSPAPSQERVSQAVSQVNEAFIQRGQNLYAAMEKDKASGLNVVKVMDKSTREVISQFPTKAIVALAEAITQSQEGKGQLLRVNA